MVDIIIHILQKRQEGEALDWPQSQVWYRQQSWDPDSVSGPVPSTILGLTVASLSQLAWWLPRDTREGRPLWDLTSFPLESPLSLCPPGLPQALLQELTNGTLYLPTISPTPLHPSEHALLPVLTTFVWILEEPLNWFPPPVFPSPNASLTNSFQNPSSNEALKTATLQLQILPSWSLRSMSRHLNLASWAPRCGWPTPASMMVGWKYIPSRLRFKSNMMFYCIWDAVLCLSIYKFQIHCTNVCYTLIGNIIFLS